MTDIGRSRGGPPPLLVLTDRRACERRGRRLLDTVSEVVSAAHDSQGLLGPPVGVVLREKDLPAGERARLATAMRACAPYLIVASDVALARAAGADGVHLAANDRWPPQLRHDTGAIVVGRSCHDAADVVDAARHGATYATLSPIFPTSSKPGYGPALGPGVLSDHAVPIFALGGIEPGRAVRCLGAGASGVAVMGAVMDADEPAAVVVTLLEEIDAARRRGKMPR